MKAHAALCALALLVTSVVAPGAAGQTPQPAARAGGRPDGQTQIAGRVTALNARTMEVTLLPRSRDNSRPVTIDASVKPRFFRYAADSFKLSDARPSTFAELKVGDHLRALGRRSQDGARFTPDEIISGSFARVGGEVTSVAGDQITIRDERTGRSHAITVGRRSTLRRIPLDLTASLAPAGGEGRQGAAAARPARSLQQLIEELPPITAADLREGDMVLVVGTTADGPSRLTAITLVTGDADFLRRWQRLQGGEDNDQMSPGLPGDVLGGGTGRGDQPTGRSDQP